MSVKRFDRTIPVKNPDREDAADIIAAWQNLQQAFERATRVEDSHLTLGIGYWPEEGEGETYESGSAFFTVDNAAELNPAREKFDYELRPEFDVLFNYDISLVRLKEGSTPIVAEEDNTHE